MHEGCMRMTAALPLSDLQNTSGGPLYMKLKR